MSTHRYPCPARPPRGPFDQCGHRHSCIHDAEHDAGRLVEHRCECGMTWTVRPGAILKREQLEARVAGAKAQIQAIADEFTQSGGMLSAHWVAAKLEHLAKHGCLGPRKGRSCIHPIAGLATGGVVDSSKLYRIGEHGYEHLAAFKAIHRTQPPVVTVKVQVPDGRWQALKARLKRIPGLDWLPVRMRWATRFKGVFESWPEVRP